MQNSGATDIRQLNQLAPSLLVSSTGSEANGSARIRGIGTVGDNPGLESSVAVFIDGVYRSRSGIGLNELGEIERIEVLRGPQGTLFGRNASAGLINIITKKPSFDPRRLWRSDDRQLRSPPRRARASPDRSATRSPSASTRSASSATASTTTSTTAPTSTTATASSRAASCCSSRTTQLSIRLIGDYSRRDEKCCGAVYVNDDIESNQIGGAQRSRRQNNIINVLRDLGQALGALQRSATAATSRCRPGRSYPRQDQGRRHFAPGRLRPRRRQADLDHRLSRLQGVAGRRLRLWHGRHPLSRRRRQQLPPLPHLQPGIAPAGLGVRRQARLAGRRLFRQRRSDAHGQSPLRQPVWPLRDLPPDHRQRRSPRSTARPRPAASSRSRARPCRARSARPARSSSRRSTGSTASATAAAPATSTTRTAATSRLFTHNIFHVTDQFDVTVGLRYTNERKKFDATFGNDNTACLAEPGRARAAS